MAISNWIFRLTVLAAFAVAGSAAKAVPSVVDFGSGDSAFVSVPNTYSEDGMTITALDTGTTADGNFSHFDHVGDNQLGSTFADRNARIHTGNNGEEVEFTFSGGAFRMVSMDIEVIEDGLTVTFLASTGATFDISSAGTIDFTALSGWSNIASFRMSAPLGTGTCSLQVVCLNMAFDNVTFDLPGTGGVPEPGALALFGIGLLGLGMAARRRKAA